MTSHDIYNQLKSVVSDPNTRGKLANRLWNSRGGSGISKAEIKNEIDQMRKRNKINDFQAKHYKNDLGAY